MHSLKVPVLAVLLTLACLAVDAAPVTLDWDVPTTRTDGSPLSQNEIASYTIYWGSVSGNYSDGSITVPGDKGHFVFDLPPGKWFVVMTTVDTQGQESVFSNEITRTINAPLPAKPNPPINLNWVSQ